LDEKLIEKLLSEAAGRLDFDRKLFYFLEGNIISTITKMLRLEIKSNTSFEIAKRRIPYINIIQMVVEKISKIYSSPPIRKLNSAEDNLYLEKLSNQMNVNEIFLEANRLYNAHNRSAIKVDFNKDTMQIEARVVPANRMIVSSNDQTNSQDPSHFIEIIELEERPLSMTDLDPLSRNSVSLGYMKGRIIVWTSEEVAIYKVDSGKITLDKKYMQDMGMTNEDGSVGGSYKNPYGMIPYVYLNKSKHILTPVENEGAYDMTLLVPRILADLNFAAQYKSHNIIWIRNVDEDHDFKLSPDGITNLGIQKNPNLPPPEMGTIESQVEIEAQLKLARFTVEAYLTSLGLRVMPSETSDLSSTNVETGISALFDLSDAVHLHKKQAARFKIFEKKFWTLVDRVNERNNQRTFGKKFIEDFIISYEESKPVKSDKAVLDEIQITREMGMISLEMSLKRLYPEYRQKDIDKLLEILKKEREQKLKDDATIAGHSSEVDSNPKQRGDDINDFNKNPIEKSSDNKKQ